MANNIFNQGSGLRSNGRRRNRNASGALGTPNRRGNFVAPNAYLSTVLRGSDVSVEDVKEAIRGIKRVQERAGNKHRFHLFMESDFGQSQSRSTEMFDNISTGLLFSPTICPYDEDEEDDISLLARVLNGISSRAAVQTPVETPSTIERTACGGRRPPPRRLFNTDDEDESEEDDLPDRQQLSSRDNDIEPVTGHGEISDDETPVAEDGRIPFGIKLPGKAFWPNYVRRAVIIPHWYPFKQGEYKTGPQTSSEVLFVDDRFVRKFEFEDESYTKWIYREFFRYIFNEAKRRKIRGLGKSLKYSEFTPPWIRTRIVRGEEHDLPNQRSLFLPKVALTDIRDQRSTWGVKRLMFLLGSFYQEEPEMSCAPLDHLLNELRQMGEQRGRGKKRSSDIQEPRSSHVRPRVSSAAPYAVGIDDGDGNHNDNSTIHRSRAREVNSNRRLVSSDQVPEILEGRTPQAPPPNPRVYARRLDEQIIEITPETREHTHDIATLRSSVFEDEDVEPTCSGSISNSVFTIRCAAGSTCRLRDSVTYQSKGKFGSNGITGKCRTCKKPLHDLCGGGEDGPMICPPCKTVQDRQEKSSA